MRHRLLLLFAIAGIVSSCGDGSETHSGYFSPIWRADGEAIYFIQRETQGRVTGLGREMLTPPADVHVARDRFSLRRIELATGATSVIVSFPDSPLAGASFQQWHGRIFSNAFARLKPAHDGLEVWIWLVDPSKQGTYFMLHQIGAAHGRWETVNEAYNFPVAELEVLNRDRELVTVPDNEGYGGTISMLTSNSPPREVLATPAMRRQYPGGIPAAIIAPQSRRAEIIRLRTLKQEEPRLRAAFRDQGLGEGDAILRANAELERQGLLLGVTKLTATRLDSLPPGIRSFRIPRKLFATGLFPDIEAAIAEPGKPVEKSFVDYVSYDYDRTSDDLNAALGTGTRRFAVDRDGEIWLLEVIPAKPLP